MWKVSKLMRNKTGAYITIYEDRKAAIECITAINSQNLLVNCIFLVDNSKQKLIESFDNVVVHHFPANIGINKGLIMALDWAIEENYNFLWTFDQDSVPHKNCLSNLIEVHQSLIEQGNRVGIVAPTAYDRRSQVIIGGVNFKNDKFTHCKYNSCIQMYECDAPITSGSLIDINAVKLIEIPTVDLFIDGVDFDYGLRLKKQGFKNFVVTNAKLDHSYGTPINISILNYKFVFQSYSPLRYYYACRNTTYLAMYYAKGLYKVTASLHRIKTTILKVIAIILFERSNKKNSVFACFIGTFDGFTNKMTNTRY
ncbi:glycosyltransferase [Chamaesiphon sp. VAR_48_metabat_403]|uniref:glycosyltransferase n=1 Tax=Chamaesiphon sp. VAR_48_metabat_403 TaxID=2964700 RepID=UPI00286DB878|nr:glycosyltransferase [Chamaesiphon sp. VAR_48_metabat_403]